MQDAESTGRRDTSQGRAIPGEAQRQMRSPAKALMKDVRGEGAGRKAGGNVLLSWRERNRAGWNGPGAGRLGNGDQDVQSKNGQESKIIDNGAAIPFIRIDRVV